MNLNRYSKTRKSLGAISTEYVIILVLIAVGGILAFMMLGQQVKEQVATSVDKVGGSTETDTAAGHVSDTEEQLRDDVTDMTQAEGGIAEEDFTVEPAGD